MLDFNAITLDNEKEVVAKFKEHGVGVSMGKFTASYANDNTAKWADLIDSSLYGVSSIKSKMLDYAHRINTACNDEFLGDLTTAFVVKDIRNKSTKFSYADCYTFLRAALRYRKETTEYLNKAAKAVKLREFIEANKSTEDKMKDAMAELTKLETELA